MFPENFLWGAATAAYQIEGAATKDGRGESIWDRFSHTPGKTADGATGDIACDHYHRWKADIALMKELELNSYRFSIAWPRIFPEGRGQVNQSGLDFYNRLTDELLDKNITPCVTLYHWDLPQALQDAGGWLNRRTIDWFAEYAATMFKTLGDRVKYWVTINEPMVCSHLGFSDGVHAPGVKDKATALQVFHHLLVAHGDAVVCGRSLVPNGKLSIVPALMMAYPFDPENASDCEAAEEAWLDSCAYQLDPLFYGTYPEKIMKWHQFNKIAPLIAGNDMQRIQQPIDFIGINHYFSMFFTRDPHNGVTVKKSPHVTQYSDLNWPVYPRGLTDLLLRIKKEYKNPPIIITENGISLNDTVAADGTVPDNRRVTFIEGFLDAAEQAIKQGVDLRGYFYWSLMDNFEWAHGYGPRFGITHVDYTTQKRTIKASGFAYRDHIRKASAGR